MALGLAVAHFSLGLRQSQQPEELHQPLQCTGTLQTDVAF